MTYLYCNSEAQSNGHKGFVKDPKWNGNKKAFTEHRNGTRTIRTTDEFAFALEFESATDALTYSMKNGLSVIVLERKDL